MNHPPSAAAQLTHPGIVTIYDVGQDGDQVFIVQEYIEGQDLEKYVKAQTPMPSAEQTARLMMAIAEAVAFAHQKGFVHRDLKPANILLTGPGSRVESRVPDSAETKRAQSSGPSPLTLDLRPRVANFGLAVHETIQRRRRGERSGTPAYIMRFATP